MSQIIPLHAKIVFASQRALDEPILLLEITDSTLNNTIRFCSYPVLRISEVPLKYGCYSQTYLYEYAFTGTLPNDQEGADISTSISFENISQEYTDAFLGLTSKNQCTLYLVLASDPDTRIRTFPLLSVTNIQITEESLSLQFTREKQVLGQQAQPEPWPSGRQTSFNAPGLHRQ